MKPLGGRRCLVTGGTRGIGAAIAARLAADGGEVTVTGRSPDGAGPEGCAYRAVDFDDADATDAFAERLAAEQVDVLVNSAGINRVTPFAEIDEADFDRIQRVNVRAPFLLCRAVLPGMRARGWGRIVNVTSIWSVLGQEGRASYSTSKFGLAGLTASLAAEGARDGVLANCVAPGVIETEMTRTVLSEEALAQLLARVPAGRLGRPEEVAALVAWLAGPENTFVSGQNVAIDGGFTRA